MDVPENVAVADGTSFAKTGDAIAKAEATAIMDRVIDFMVDGDVKPRRGFGRGFHMDKQAADAGIGLYGPNQGWGVLKQGHRGFSQSVYGAARTAAGRSKSRQPPSPQQGLDRNHRTGPRGLPQWQHGRRLLTAGKTPRLPSSRKPFSKTGGSEGARAAANALKRVSITIALLAIIACATAGPLAPTSAATTAAADRGRAYVSRNCAECHAINTGQSPNGGAPTFAIIRPRTNEHSVERRLAQLSRKGHFEMPPRSISDDEIKDVAAYIQTVEPARARTSPPRD